LDLADRVFLVRLGINPEDAPIVQRESDKLVIHSINFSRNADIGQIGHLWMGTIYLSMSGMGVLNHCFGIK
jgi:hypothetical protein